MTYDPLDVGTWSDEDLLRLGEVVDGLGNFDLGPLAAYLREGRFVPPPVSEWIAEAIEGGDLVDYKITITGKRRGQKRQSEIEALRDRRMCVGLYAEGRFRQLGPGSYEAAMAATQERFSVSRKTANGARQFALEYLEKMAGVEPGFDHFKEASERWFTPNA